MGPGGLGFVVVLVCDLSNSDEAQPDDEPEEGDDLEYPLAKLEEVPEDTEELPEAPWGEVGRKAKVV